MATRYLMSDHPKNDRMVIIRYHEDDLTPGSHMDGFYDDEIQKWIVHEDDDTWVELDLVNDFNQPICWYELTDWIDNPLDAEGVAA